MKYLGKTLIAALALLGAPATFASFTPGEMVIVLNSGDGSISIVDPVAKKEVLVEIDQWLVRAPSASRR